MLKRSTDGCTPFGKGDLKTRSQNKKHFRIERHANADICQPLDHKALLTGLSVILISTQSYPAATYQIYCWYCPVVISHYMVIVPFPEHRTDHQRYYIFQSSLARAYPPLPTFASACAWCKTRSRSRRVFLSEIQDKYKYVHVEFRMCGLNQPIIPKEKSK